ncbi:MAG TPA: thiamine diphosphokinase [Gaiellaceae bacterium]|nr:thiamine diphosphokinase [Gaiellaceae bacterium]
MDTVVVLAGGPIAAPPELPPDALVIAADSGAELAPGRVDLAIGDFDSIAPATLAGLAHVEAHPAAKDATDLELALDAALRAAPRRVLVLGSDGGRLDHLLGSLLLLASDRYASVQVDARLGPAAVHVIRGERMLTGEPDELVSLFAVHGPAHRVSTRGLLYPLSGETLEPGSSRGTSNRFVEREARVEVAGGVLLAVRPSGTAAAGTAS